MKKVFDDGINNIIVSIPDNAVNIIWWKEISYNSKQKEFGFKENFNDQKFIINDISIYSNGYIIINVNVGEYILPKGSKLISTSDPSLLDELNTSYVSKHHRRNKIKERLEI